MAVHNKVILALPQTPTPTSHPEEEERGEKKKRKERRRRKKKKKKSIYQKVTLNYPQEYERSILTVEVITSA